MRMRTLGGTGIKVSPYCLGAMMFGAWGGNPDHDAHTANRASGPVNGRCPGEVPPRARSAAGDPGGSSSRINTVPKSVVPSWAHSVILDAHSCAA